MSRQLTMSAGAASGSGALTAGDWISRFLFIAALLFSWVSIDPFVNLADPATLLPNEGGNFANQIVVSLLTIGVLWRAATLNLSVAKVLLTWSAVLLFAWFALSAVVSTDPGVSLRRYALTLMIFAMATGALILLRDATDFAKMIAVVALTVLVLCFGGVLLAPQYSIHQATDLMEPTHAGDWRGLFTQKNEAGSAMVISVFMGLFVAHKLNRALGWMIVIASAAFLAFTHAKTSILMIFPVLILAWIVASTRSLTLRAVLIWGGLALTNLFTVGSLIFAPIRAFVSAFMPDPTFTNRIDIWSFVLGKIPERLWFGQGYEAFWGSNAVLFGESRNWANMAPNAHNCYLDLLLTTGLPGLILAVLYVVICPTIDFHRGIESGNDRATTVLFLRIWLFSIYYGCLESFMFTNGGPVWFMMLIAILGLRILNATSTQVASHARSNPAGSLLKTYPT